MITSASLRYPLPIEHVMSPLMPTTFTSGLISLHDWVIASILLEASATCFLLNRIDLERLDNSTVSKSTTKTLPTPRSTRFFMTSFPKAPPPTTSTFAFLTISSFHQLILSYTAVQSSFVDLILIIYLSWNYIRIINFVQNPSLH